MPPYGNALSDGKAIDIDDVHEAALGGLHIATFVAQSVDADEKLLAVGGDRRQVRITFRERHLTERLAGINIYVEQCVLGLTGDESVFCVV
jgi:hypothetical protein